MNRYTPDFFGGFSTNLSWKNLDMSAVFGYSVGGKIYNYAVPEYDSDGTYYRPRNQMKLQDGWSRWEKPGDITTHPKGIYNNSTNSNKTSSRFLEDGSYLKLRNLPLVYNLALPEWYISNLRLFVSGENLFTLTDYSGVDPEIPPHDGKITGVKPTAVYPSTRKFMFGLNVTFLIVRKDEKILTIALAAACSFTACDIERLPYDKYSADKITEDKQASLDILLNGCYAQLKGWSDVMHRVGGICRRQYDDKGFVYRCAFICVYFISTSPSNYRLNTFWNNSYKVISQAKRTWWSWLKGRDSRSQSASGWGYYLRGTMYFYLCRAYGRPYYQSPETNLGVPIVNGLPADLNNLVLPDRASVKIPMRTGNCRPP